jgi:hypothetical protein
MSDSGPLFLRTEDLQGEASEGEMAASGHDASPDPIDQLLFSSGTEGKPEPEPEASDDVSQAGSVSGDALRSEPAAFNLSGFGIATSPRSETRPDENLQPDAAQDAQTEPDTSPYDVSQASLPPDDMAQPDAQPGERPDAAQDVQTERDTSPYDVSQAQMPSDEMAQPDDQSGERPDAAQDVQAKPDTSLYDMSQAQMPSHEMAQPDDQSREVPQTGAAAAGEIPQRDAEPDDVPQEESAPPDLGAVNEEEAVARDAPVTERAAGDADEKLLLPEGFKVVDGDDLVPRLALQPVGYSEEELNSVLASFMMSHGRTFKDIPRVMRRPLFQHISRKRVVAIGNQDYEYGQRLVWAADLLRQLIAQELSEADVAYGAETLESRLQRAKTALREAELRCAERVKRLDDELHERELEMKARHDVEIHQFQDEWADPKSFHKWNKPSSQLLLVRVTEKNLALTGDFPGATQMKRCGERLERVETSEAQRRAKEAMEMEFQQLIERHMKEHEGHDRLKHKAMRQAEVVNNAELTPLKMAVRKLEALRAQKILPKRSPRISRSKLEVKRRPEAILHDDRPPVPTPRTMQRLQSIRETPRNATLPLTAVATTAYIRAKKPKDKPKPVHPKKAGDF